MSMLNTDLDKNQLQTFFPQSRYWASPVIRASWELAKMKSSFVMAFLYPVSSE